MLHPVFAGDLHAYCQKQRASRCCLAATFVGAEFVPSKLVNMKDSEAREHF